MAIAIALCLGLGYALLLLGPAGAVGTAPFWALPTGLLGGSLLDIRNALAGYWWFVQDSWRWPLLALGNPDWPHGANAELFDIVPVVAILGKLLRTGFGLAVDPYPWWVTFCLAMNAASLAALVRALGQRSVLGAVLAGAFGAMAPVVQFRFGHLSLMAHWLPVLTLALYCHARSRRFDARIASAAVGLCLLACCVHPLCHDRGHRRRRRAAGDVRPASFARARRRHDAAAGVRRRRPAVGLRPAARGGISAASPVISPVTP